MSNDDVPPSESEAVPRAMLNDTKPEITEEAAPATSINEDPRLTSRPTVRLDPTDLKPSWPVVIATLEQLANWATLALRLGTLALIQECVRELAQRDARPELVNRLRILVDALAHMPFDPKGT